MDQIKLTALSRTVVKHNYGLITGDGFVNSVVPGWRDCEVNVVINEAMGADFCQLITTLTPESQLVGELRTSQLFFFVIEGSCTITVNEQKEKLEKGSYVYLPPNTTYEISGAEALTELLSFQKQYEYLDDTTAPDVVISHERDIEKAMYLGDPGLWMQNLLPDSTDMRFDMAVNIFTYHPGARLPFVETHIMEHGLIYLQGEGIYRLDDDWYPVRAGDCIWMAPYCPQWFGALGTDSAVYIYYKNVNRFPIPQ